VIQLVERVHSFWRIQNNNLVWGGGGIELQYETTQTAKNTKAKYRSKRFCFEDEMVVLTTFQIHS
jgi:hypothetical protein